MKEHPNEHASAMKNNFAYACVEKIAQQIIDDNRLIIIPCEALQAALCDLMRGDATYLKAYLAIEVRKQAIDEILAVNKFIVANVGVVLDKLSETGNSL